MRTYITQEAFSTTKCVELVGKKEFADIALDLKQETFIIYVASLNSIESLSSVISPISILLNVIIHLSHRPEIANLIAKKPFTKVSAKYADFADVFSTDLISKLPEYTGINNHTMKLVDDQQLFYRLIYSLEPIKSKTLKAYIEMNLANGFIRPSKSLINALILFDQKSYGSFQLCIKYRGFNNLTIKNQYPLPRIRKLLDRLGKAWRFT